MSALTRSELAEALAKKFRLPRHKAKDVVEDVLLQIASALTDGRRVELRSFGSFEAVVRKASNCCLDPRKPELGRVMTRSRRKIKFRVGRDLDAILNQPETQP